MKQQILQILNNKKNNIKFKSKLFADEFENSNLEDLRYYLWLCELELYLQEKYNIFISILHECYVLKTTSYFYYYVIQDKIRICNPGDKFDTILDKSEQNIPGNHINDDLLEKYIFEDRLGFITKKEALEAAVYDILNIIIKENE